MSANKVRIVKGSSEHFLKVGTIKKEPKFPYYRYTIEFPDGSTAKFSCMEFTKE